MEKLLHLFNTLWFERRFLPESPPIGSLCMLDRPAMKISHVRSSSDQLIIGSSKINDMLSPKFVKKTKEVKKGRRRRSKSLSLTELQVEEVKGFMDLGFVFSEEDHNDSSLVSIIPGLQRQRLGGGGGGGGGEQVDGVSRPYLSEAWKCERHLKKQHLRLKLRGATVKSMPMVDELEMKNHIKFWAHSVASAVRC